MAYTHELLNRSGRNAFTGFSIPIIILVCLLTHTIPGFGQCTAPTFAPATNFAAGDGPYKMAVGDFNGDRNLDLAVPNINADRVSILLGNGAGSFMLGGSFPVGHEPTAAAAGDFNNDGKLDLAVVNATSFGNGDMSILIGNGAGGFSAPTSYRVIAFNSDVTATDLNNDGKLDIVAGTYSEQLGNVKVLLGDGIGSFGAIADFGGNGDARSPVVADFNGDGKLDIAVAIDSEVGGFLHTGSRISVLIGDGTGRFGAPTNFTVGIGPLSMAGGDLNGDGKLDLVVANGTSNNVSVLLGDGLGIFGAATNLALQGFPNSVRLGDLNGDGKLDLVVSSNVSGTVAVLLGNGDGKFSLPTEFAVGTQPVYVVLGDFNGDSKNDIAVANFSSDDVSILINTCSSAVLGRQVVTNMRFDRTSAVAGSSFSADISGSNLTTQTLFDVRFTGPGSTTPNVALNWQIGFQSTHNVPVGIVPGTWTINGVRPHQIETDHTADFFPVSATIAIVEPQQVVMALRFDRTSVVVGSSFSANISGSNLTTQTFFDVRFTALGSTTSNVVLNWQIGFQSSHDVPVGIVPGTWTINGVRPHLIETDHTGDFFPVSATITVLP